MTEREIFNGGTYNPYAVKKGKRKKPHYILLFLLTTTKCCINFNPVIIALHRKEKS
jgi:hypothetical protein